MPLTLRGTTYPLPGEGEHSTFTGRELMAIEDEFGLDALQLMSSLAADAKPQPGYTRAKAFFALAWSAVHRVDPTWTLARFLNEVALDEIDVAEEQNPTNAASSAAESAVA